LNEPTHIIKPEDVPNGAADAARVEHPLPGAHFDDKAENRISKRDADGTAKISGDEFASLVRRNPPSGQLVHGGPRDSANEALKESQSDHPAIVEIADNRHEMAHDATNEVRKAKDELCPVLGGHDAPK
jgi:hypothetical protein